MYVLRWEREGAFLRAAHDAHLTRVSVLQAAVAVAAILLLVNSCTSRRASIAMTQAEQEQRQPAGVLGEQSRALDKLRSAVQEQIASAERNRLEEESKIRSTPPYFYKRFGLYPIGLGEPEFMIKETGSTLKPYQASVTTRKARLTTKYHTSRSACARDKEFMRDMGTQTDTYVYESGKWTLMYSLFEVEKTSVLRGDTWVDVTGEVDRIAEDERESAFAKLGAFFRRLF